MSYGCGCGTRIAGYPAFGYGYPVGGGFGTSFALIVVLFILLIIIGATWVAA